MEGANLIIPSEDIMVLRRGRVNVDLNRGQLVVCEGKADKDRLTVLAESLTERLRAHRDTLRTVHEQDPAGPARDS